MNYLWWLASAWTAYLVFNGFSTGSVLLKGGRRADRMQSPKTYWVAMIFYSLAVFLFLAMPFIA